LGLKEPILTAKIIRCNYIVHVGKLSRTTLLKFNSLQFHSFPSLAKLFRR